MPITSRSRSSPTTTRSPTAITAEKALLYGRSGRNRVPGEMFEYAHQPRMIPTLAAERRGGGEHPLGRGGIVQRETQSARTLQGEVEVLLVQLDAEARVEAALDHALPMNL